MTDLEALVLLALVSTCAVYVYVTRDLVLALRGRARRVRD
jgi:hypothetical protein